MRPQSPEGPEPTHAATAADPAGSPSSHQEAWDAALRYLSYRSRSRWELERHLLRAAHETATVAGVLVRAEELGLVDDRAFAAAFVRDRIRLRPRGVIRLMAELRARGVGPEDARLGIAQAFDEEEVSEGQLLLDAARARLKRLEAVSQPVARRRLRDYLIRAGFPADDVERVSEALIEDREGAG